MKNKALALTLFAIILSGCVSNNPSTCKGSNESSNDGTTIVTLTKDNIDTYFNVSQTGQYGMYRMDYTISFKGVLTFAVYENVIVTLNMHIYAEDGAPYYNAMNNDFVRDLPLNAAGEGTSTLYYSDATIDHVVETGLGYDMLAHYECTWSIKAISGNVRYRL